jgi:hydrogenase-4 component E
VSQLDSAAYNLTHFFAGLMLVMSFALIYQDRMLAVLRTFALQAVLLAIVVAWEAWVQDRPHLFITSALAFGLKGIIIPAALHRMIFKLRIHRDVEKVVSVGMTMLFGLGLTALSFMLVLKATASAPAFAREGLAIALAIILLGLLMMITRRNALTQIIGFMSIENGLILGATGARGMPLVVEISVAFSVLIALFVFAVFVFRIRERFDTVDVAALEHARADES